MEVTHCNIIAMAIKSESTLEGRGGRGELRGEEEHGCPKVGMVVVISSSWKVT